MKKLNLSFIAVLIFLGFSIDNKLKVDSSELVIFHRSKQSLLGLKNNRKLLIYASDSMQNASEKYPLKSYISKMRIKEINKEKLHPIFRYQNQNVLVIDSLGIYPITNSVGIILLTQSPKLNLERLIDSLNPKMIIADGSNYTSYIRRWEKTCETKKLPFQHTAKTGAIIFK